MLPESLEALKRTKRQCKLMVTKKAVLSAAAAMIPVPGTDLVVDIGLMFRLIPAVNERFGLTPEQIAALDEESRARVESTIQQLDSLFVGKTVTKKLIIKALKKLTGKIIASKALKVIPLVGQTTSAALSFGVMKYVGNSHVDDCFRVCRQILDDKNEARRS